LWGKRSEREELRATHGSTVSPGDDKSIASSSSLWHLKLNGIVIHCILARDYPELFIFTYKKES
jgi:hypothetical protein